MLDRLIKSTIRWMPTGAALACAKHLASRPPRPPISEAEGAAMAKATRLAGLKWNGDAVWSWGTGPTVLLVHGWGGRAAQMAPMALTIAQHGMRAVAFDIAGHGSSPEPLAKWEFFIRDIGVMSHRLGNVHGHVGHSAGGLSMMAARHLYALAPSKFVCICAPSHPHPPVRGLAQRLNPRASVLERYKTFLANQFQSSWSDLEAGAAYRGAGADLLLCYDHKDRFVDHSDGDRIQSFCPGSQLLKTKAHGHTRILAAPDVIQSVTDFLAPSPAKQRMTAVA
ncbi:alpha/beta fold hydrolase [Bradyrhizobium tropiciagri]|uniref:alpha/beta hydrolase n=1 Tax=Bradyrhizobium tropiciagri TaxID=312253 RepID=UPI001BAA0011|nr:alpha/beta fold hydrolase [Bradyrhizobium tropiciagri]MBR0894959.1 alpha/beta fold hydrolase [Bradyrhizobium tropiciagri]